jgi:predicted nucleotidyltransferase
VAYEAIVDAIRSAVPAVQAIYVFGSHARGDSGPESDLDVALLAPTRLDPLARWELQERLAGLAHCSLDLVDLLAASAVMRVAVLADAVLLFDGAPYERALFEATALSGYARLQDERRAILEQIEREGRVYG